MNFLNKTVEYATLLFIFLIPWQARWIITPGQINGSYWEYGTISLYLSEIILLIALLAVVIKGIIYFKNNKNSFSFANIKSKSGFLLLIVIWAAVSVFWAIDKELAYEKLIILIEAVALFLILYSKVISFKKIGWVIILSGLVQSIAAILQFIYQAIPASTWLGMASQSADVLGASVVETSNGRWLRAYGSFGHPNILGAWLVLSLIFLVSTFNCNVGNRQQIAGKLIKLLFAIRYYLFAIILFALLTTFSRAAWLAFFVFIVGRYLSSVAYRQFASLPALFGFKRISSLIFRNDIAKEDFHLKNHSCAPITKIIILSGAVVLLFASYAPDPFFARLEGGERLEIKSNQERVASISQGWQIIKNHPLLGIGLGNYGLAVYNEIDSNRPAYFYQPIHNVFLLIMAELGLIGIFLMAYGFSLFAFRSSLFAFFALILLSMFDHYFWSLYSGVLILAVWLFFIFKENDKFDTKDRLS